MLLDIFIYFTYLLVLLLCYILWNDHYVYIIYIYILWFTKTHLGSQNVRIDIVCVTELKMNTSPGQVVVHVEQVHCPVDLCNGTSGPSHSVQCLL